MSELRGMEAPAASGDKLTLIRNKVREARDITREVMDLEERLKDRKKRLNDITQKELVDVFDGNQITELGLEPEGNLPGYHATIKPYYHANIKAEWPPEKQHEGYKTLERWGGGYIIKTQYIISFSKEQRAEAKAFEKVLDGLGVSYSILLGVPWSTLTSWLKERCEFVMKAGTKKLKKFEGVPPLEPLGASVGRVVVLKEVKGK